jgi:RNA polymerase sigma-70 factor, ECF subfamily
VAPIGQAPGTGAGTSLAEPDAPDEDLVARLRAGDEIAFGALVARHRPWLVRLCTRLLDYDAHAAEDAVQESLLKLHTATQRDTRPLRVRPWLAVVARNACVDQQRRRRPELPGELPDRAGHSQDPFEIDPSLGEAWTRLSGRHREVLYLREVLGLSYKEIAGVMDLTLPAVETLVFRARAALRREYERAGGAVFGCGLLGLHLARLGRGDRRTVAGNHAAACPDCGRALDGLRMADTIGNSATAAEGVASAAHAGISPAAVGNADLGGLSQRMAQMLSTSLPGGEQAVAKLLSAAAGMMMAAASVIPAVVPFVDATRPAAAAAASTSGHPRAPAALTVRPGPATGTSVGFPAGAGAKPVSLQTMLATASPHASLPRRRQESGTGMPATPPATRPAFDPPRRNAAGLAGTATRRTGDRPAPPAAPVDRPSATAKLRSLLPEPSAPVERPDRPNRPAEAVREAVASLAQDPAPPPVPPVSDPAPALPVSDPAPPPAPADPPLEAPSTEPAVADAAPVPGGTWLGMPRFSVS